MTKSQYLDMCEQMGEDPDWDKCPLDIEDFPELVLTTLNLYNSLGDKIYPDIGYTGKDFTNFNFLLNKFGIEKHQEEYIFDIILWLDARQIKNSQDRIKAEHDKIKNKHKHGR